MFRRGYEICLTFGIFSPYSNDTNKKIFSEDHLHLWVKKYEL